VLTEPLLTADGQLLAWFLPSVEPDDGDVILLSERTPRPLSRRAIASEGLTRREGQVLELVRLGLTNAQLARELSISPRTVQHHLAHIYKKLGVRNRAGALGRVLPEPSEG
jgi:DNA-binding CsgD family transcriptional regulator